ncbi:MAG TPA: leucyl aminopeptidase [Dietzia timorensis]|uniref:Probable cytosol aminopeptidase n=2 Tax=Dietzia timorensis TaxID=499555 RepID=A0A921JZ53_9ACTN|nr:leucyl aminopeptidase [Dietzia timorensis]HJE91834.1 leucyl aminopeptidase [Dietzia timorensis]
MPSAKSILAASSDVPTLASAKEIDPAADALVVGLVDGDGDEVEVVSSVLPSAALEELAAAARALKASAKVGKVTALSIRAEGVPPVVFAAGLGDAVSAVTNEDLRQAAGSAARAARGHGNVVFVLAPAGDGKERIPEAAEVALGAGLGGFGALKVTGSGEESDSANDNNRDTFAILGAAAEDIERATAVAESVAATRNFINTPPNLLYPETFAARAAELAEAVGVTAEVLDDQALRDGEFGGINGVGQGSSRPPRLLRLTYAPKSDGPTVALVGKGITFDTGGISLKPAAGMEQMTMDMGGAAAVIGTVLAAARLGVAVNVTATVPMAENMPGGNSYRPGDVLTMYGGKTVEITNTDAEGRLILADAIVRACEDTPDYLIDTATLTGAQMVALGMRTPGVMGTEEFRGRVAALSKEVGENAWEMPLPEELREGLDSKVADMVNSASSRWGGMLVAGLFLREFVSEGLPWAHIDVAGPAFNTGGAWGYYPAGATGVPLRTMLAVLEDVAAKG